MEYSTEDVVVLKVTKNKHEMIINFQDPENFECPSVNAYGGAYAFCKMNGIEPQMYAQEPVGPQDDEDETYQLFIGVKTILPKDSYLDCNEQQAQKALDIYVLIRGNNPTFTYMGWATKAQLLSQENRVSYADIMPGGRGLGYRMHVSRLTESINLSDLVTQKSTRKDGANQGLQRIMKPDGFMPTTLEEEAIKKEGSEELVKQFLYEIASSLDSDLESIPFPLPYLIIKAWDVKDTIAIPDKTLVIPVPYFKNKADEIRIFTEIGQQLYAKRMMPIIICMVFEGEQHNKSTREFLFIFSMSVAGSCYGTYAEIIDGKIETFREVEKAENYRIHDIFIGYLGSFLKHNKKILS
jgi:hypothetical protein